MNMSKPSAINRQACQWIAKLHESELSEKEHAELKAWMAESPENRAEMRRMAKRWEELNSLTLLAVPADQIEEQLKKKSNSHRNSSRLKVGMAAVAACFALVALIWPQFWLDDTNIPSLQSYSTDIGEQQLITLPDNSTVLLNTQSQFNVAYSADYRDIYLVHGEAHFEVESDAERPFRVFAGKSKVRAVGTAFSVYLKKETVEVTVTHGKVEIDSIRDSIGDNTPLLDVVPVSNRSIVSAGQVAEFDQLVGTIKTDILPETSHIPAWHHGQLKFTGEPLEEVVEEISRYSPFSIVILDSELRNLRIGGLFDVGETRKMFDALEEGFGIKANYINENLVHLTVASSSVNQL